MKVTLLLLLMAQISESRDWIYNYFGETKIIKAKFLGFNNNRVHLKTDNGDLLILKPSDLSNTDVRWYREQLRLKRVTSFDNQLRNYRMQRARARSQRRRQDLDQAYRQMYQGIQQTRRQFNRIYGRRGNRQGGC